MYRLLNLVWEHLASHANIQAICWGKSLVDMFRLDKRAALPFS